MHSGKSQNARQRALNNFKSLHTKVLVATDIAARGIDIEKLSHVFNYDIPNIPETYVHRIGRTGRAGLGGIALSFCENEERDYWKDIIKLIKIQVPVIHDHPYKISSEAVQKNEQQQKVKSTSPEKTIMQKNQVHLVLIKIEKEDGDESLIQIKLRSNFLIVIPVKTRI
ncbi:MAG: hypothetical protein MZV64_07390 [Ignavibacteriales bacterium]|nr:hypothetical protein [Ignavibacteriales bacterium]